MLLLSDETPSSAPLALGNAREELLAFGEQQEFPLMFNVFVKQAIRLFSKCAVITINTHGRTQVMSIVHCWERADLVR